MTTIEAAAPLLPGQHVTILARAYAGMAGPVVQVWADGEVEVDLGYTSPVRFRREQVEMCLKEAAE